MKKLIFALATIAPIISYSSCLGLMEIHYEDELNNRAHKYYDYNSILKNRKELYTLEKEGIKSNEDIKFYGDLIEILSDNMGDEKIVAFKNSIIGRRGVSNSDFVQLLKNLNQLIKLCHNTDYFMLTDHGRSYLEERGYDNYDDVVRNRNNDPVTLNWFMKGSLSEPEFDIYVGYPMSVKNIKKVILESVNN